jgi:hypothetical protein
MEELARGRILSGPPGMSKMAAGTIRGLRRLRGVGPSILKDLEALGVRSVEQLARQDGGKLYDRLCRLKGARQDPCVLDTLHCAVAQARDPQLPREQRDWWWWSRQRKAGHK